VSSGKATPVIPFYTLTIPWSAEQQLAVARSHSDAIARHAAPLRQALGFQPLPPTPTERLRIGYLSCEFRDHAVSHLVQGIFGLHDRRAFEVFAYSFGPDDGSSYRQRISRDCDHFRDLRVVPLADSARRIHDDRLHILIDLQGHVGFSRLGLMALRPATIQVNYLGHPATIGADFIDYFIGDPITTPLERSADFREQLVLLPHCYLATDNSQPVSESAGTRAEHGLPESGIVFCAFNNSYKIEPEVFGVWMRILKAVPGSVLWLSPAAAPIEQNLRREAEARQVPAVRLIFARRMPRKADHLARHRLADLFLDTGIYNGHTTACDALWAGLPVLTTPGGTFPSRVGASLLTAIGLPELIAPDRQSYEELAVHLATHPAALKEVRQTLAAHRTARPLFDAPRLVRNLEKAYRAMWETYAAGRPPQAIVVTDP
jgi:predicted O-linked N-acetylglucosamine transferase (SPINDLY family)